MPRGSEVVGSGLTRAHYTSAAVLLVALASFGSTVAYYAAHPGPQKPSNFASGGAAEILDATGVVYYSPHVELWLVDWQGFNGLMRLAGFVEILTDSEIAAEKMIECMDRGRRDETIPVSLALTAALDRCGPPRRPPPLPPTPALI